MGYRDPYPSLELTGSFGGFYTYNETSPLGLFPGFQEFISGQFPGRR